MWLFGIDVSNHNGMINWDKVNASLIGFVYMLTSDGTFRGRPPGAQLSIVDAFNRNRLLCKKPKGPYHFARPKTNRPVASADQVWQEIGAPMDIPPVLDMEPEGTQGLSTGAMVDWAGQWLSRMDYHTGQTSILYAGVGLDLIRYFPQRTWWLPYYSANTLVDPDPFKIDQPKLKGNRNWDIWQFTDKGRLDGIPGDVDKNLAHASVFAKMIGAESLMTCFMGVQGQDSQYVLVASSKGLVRVGLGSLRQRDWLVQSAGYEDRTIWLSEPGAVEEFRQIRESSLDEVVIDPAQIASQVVAQSGSQLGALVVHNMIATLKKMVDSLEG